MTNEKCCFCGNIHFMNDLVPYQYRDGSQLFFVNNVPAEVCTFCGEAFFQSEVVKKIESEYDSIKANRKVASHFIKVPMEEYMDIKDIVQ